MRYSFEVLEAKRKGLISRMMFGSQTELKILFCKVDCTPTELEFLDRNQKLNMTVYEHNVGDRPETKLLKRAHQMTRPRDAKTQRDDDNYFADRWNIAIPLREFITGASLSFREHEIPNAEDVIEARLIDIGTEMKRALERSRKRGRTHEI